MNDPERLHDAGTADERRLIALARSDSPPLGALERTFTTLGVASVVALVPGAAQAAGLGSGAAAATSVASGSGVTLVSLAKWLSLGALGGIVTAAAATAATWTSRTSAPSAPAAALPSITLGRPAAPAGSLPSRSEASELSSAPRAPAVPPAASSASDTLGAELSLLERTRRALAEGRANEARALLGVHRQRFDAPALSEEADVLRIEVLLAHGELELGEQSARDFLAAHPKSPHAERVRSLLPRFRRDPKPVEWPSNP